MIDFLFFSQAIWTSTESLRQSSFATRQMVRSSSSFLSSLSCSWLSWLWSWSWSYFELFLHNGRADRPTKLQLEPLRHAKDCRTYNLWFLTNFLPWKFNRRNLKRPVKKKNYYWHFFRQMSQLKWRWKKWQRKSRRFLRHSFNFEFDYRIAL